jgi:2-methylisocitrate lyase-like PEP mutase family enzyme
MPLRSRSGGGNQKERAMSPHIPALRDIVASRSGVLLPGAPNALAARIIADLGFRAIYLTGAGLTNMSLGLPDLGFMDLSQAVAHTMAIRNVTELPIVVDADTGFGNAVNVTHTVRMLERAGASAIQIEDQASPKRCGHFEGKELISAREMVAKVKAAVDARREGIVVIARTDARAGEGFQAALDRAGQYIEAGADMTFLEAPQSMDEVRQVPQALGVPQLLNIVVGGKTPVIGQAQAAEMGFGLLLYANAALQGAVIGMQRALTALRDDGAINEADGLLAPFAERQRLVGKPDFDALEKKYAVH